MLAIVLVGSSKRPYESRLSTAFTKTTMLFSKTTQWKEIFEYKHERQKKKKEYRFHKYTVPQCLSGMARADLGTSSMIWPNIDIK